MDINLELMLLAAYFLRKDALVLYHGVIVNHASIVLRAIDEYQRDIFLWFVHSSSLTLSSFSSCLSNCFFASVFSTFYLQLSMIA